MALHLLKDGKNEALTLEKHLFLHLDDLLLNVKIFRHNRKRQWTRVEFFCRFRDNIKTEITRVKSNLRCEKRGSQTISRVLCSAAAECLSFIWAYRHRQALSFYPPASLLTRLGWATLRRRFTRTFILRCAQPLCCHSNW